VNNQASSIICAS